MDKQQHMLGLHVGIIACRLLTVEQFMPLDGKIFSNNIHAAADNSKLLIRLYVLLLD